MGLFDKIKDHVKDAVEGTAVEAKAKFAFEKEYGEQQEAIATLEQMAGKQEDGGGSWLGENHRRVRWTRELLGSDEDVVGVAVQGGDPRFSIKGIKALLKQSAEEAGEMTGDGPAMVDLEVEGDGMAAAWPADRRAWIVLTEAHLLVLDDPTFPGRRHFKELARIRADDVKEMGGGKGETHNILEITFKDGSSVRTPISGDTDPGYFTYVLPRRKNFEALERARND